MELKQSTHFQVTPSDTTIFTNMPDMIYANAGDVALVDAAGNSVIYTLDQSGYIYGKFQKVLATGTTATRIVGIVFHVSKKV